MLDHGWWWAAGGRGGLVDWWTHTSGICGRGCGNWRSIKPIQQAMGNPAAHFPSLLPSTLKPSLAGRYTPANNFEIISRTVILPHLLSLHYTPPSYPTLPQPHSCCHQAPSLSSSVTIHTSLSPLVLHRHPLAKHSFKTNKQTIRLLTTRP